MSSAVLGCSVWTHASSLFSLVRYTTTVALPSRISRDEKQVGLKHVTAPLPTHTGEP